MKHQEHGHTRIFASNSLKIYIAEEHIIILSHMNQNMNKQSVISIFHLMNILVRFICCFFFFFSFFFLKDVFSEKKKW
jgi:hypothetical protein